MSESQVESCPKCSHEMPVITGYVTWCEQCNWNIHPNWHPTESLSLFERFQHRLGVRSANLLYEELIGTKSFTYPVTIGTIGAYFFSILLHFACFGMIAMMVLKLFWPRFLGDFILGVLLLFLCIGLYWPTRNKIPTMKLTRGDYPALHRLMDEISKVTGSPKVTSLIAHYEFNAFAARSLLRRQTTVGLGVPLFSILNLREKIAVIAHELGHLANRDMTRKLIVRQAMRTLGSCYHLLIPKYDYSELFGPFYHLIVIIRKRLADLVYYAYYLLGLSVWKQSQRSEYYADLTSARVVGTNAAAAALGKLHFSPTYWMTLEKVAQHGYTTELFEELRKFTNNVPEKEQRRIQKISESLAVQPDSSHPPTMYRIQNLNRHPVDIPSLALDETFIEQLNQEFGQLEKSMQVRLLDDYRSWYL